MPEASASPSPLLEPLDSSSLTPNASPADSSASLRRSARPKPSPQSLRSSPPAIKFYESTKLSTTSKKPKLSVPETELSPIISSSSSSSSSLKLRLAPRSPSPKTKVVKLMMPLMETLPDSPSNRNLPTIAPKPSGPSSLLGKLSLRLFESSSSSLLSVEEASKPLKEVEAVKKAKESKELKESKEGKEGHKETRSKAEKKKLFTQPSTELLAIEPPSTPALPVNDDHCAACNGTGNFICCDSCPRSFHFTCAEPPLDPNNLPEDDWFCSECRALASSKTSVAFVKGSQFDSIWQEMFVDINRVNPKCFVMPKRFRNSRERDFEESVSAVNTTGTSIVNANATPLPVQPSNSKGPSQIVLPNASIVTAAGIKAPSIAHLKSQRGFCHCCNRLGLTRRAIESESTPLLTPDSRQARPLLSCSICPLYFHLDCLDPPLATMPPQTQCDRWCCPVHFTKERCLALEISEPLVTACYLLPESAIKLQFIQKRQRLADEIASGQSLEDEEQRLCNCNRIVIPLAIKEAYE